MSLLLALKLGLVPALIAGITLAGRRWGPSVAGWLSAFPVVAGPILFFIALEQGPAFAANAAAATLSAVLAILVFGISYAWAATRYSWSVSALAGFLAYFGAVVCLGFWTPSLLVAASTVLASLLVAPRLFPTLAADIQTPATTSNDMHWRMIAGAILVFLVTQFSSHLGPKLSGVFAMFPVMLSVLVIFSHRHSGSAFAVRLVRGTVLGYYAFAAFCITLSLALPHVGIGTAFFAASALASVIQAASRIYLQRVQQAAPVDAAALRQRA